MTACWRVSGKVFVPMHRMYQVLYGCVKYIIALAEEGWLRGQTRSREATFCPRRRGGQFGGIFSFAGLTTPAALQSRIRRTILLRSLPPRLCEERNVRGLNWGN